jgi:GlpG protein
MRQIGTIPTESEANRFGDYLLTLGIGNSVEESPSANEWAVWVDHDDHLDRATSELTSFLSNPNDPRYAAAAKQAGTVRAEQQRAEKRRQKQFVDVRTRWSQPKQWNVPLTLALIGFSVLVTIVTGLGSNRRNDTADALRINAVEYVNTPEGEYAMPKPYLDSVKNHYELWRLITPIFLHYGIFHILFNMLWLRDLGGMIETRKGTLFFAILVITTAVISNLAQYAWTHSPFFGGMSGVVFGLFGYVWVRGRLDPAGGIGIARESAIMMFVWLFVCMTGLVGPIANGAHVVGLLVGLAFAYLPYVFRKLLR